MRIAMALLALSLSVGSGCKKKETVPATTGSADSTTGSGSAVATGSDMAGSGSGSAAMAGSGSDMAGSGSAAMAGSGSDMAGSGAGDTAMAHKAGMCPSTVLGSTTKAELKGKTVVLTVTATDKDAIVAIQKRTEELLKEKSDSTAGGSTAHDQKGSHGGGTGLCPVYWTEGGKATSKKDKQGVVITITPKDKAEDLKTEIDARVTKAADWVKTNLKDGTDKNIGGVGGGKGTGGGGGAGTGSGSAKP